jgi:hypothetical protein
MIDESRTVLGWTAAERHRLGVSMEDLREDLDDKIVDWSESVGCMVSFMYSRYLSGPTRSSMTMFRHEGVTSFSVESGLLHCIGKLMHEATRCQVELIEFYNR